jgi:uncharacterized cupin superfamily protein
MPKPNLVRPADHAATPEAHWSFSHPFNPASQVAAVALSRMTGLERTGVNLMRVPPGKESFAYHTHACEEEWIYVLAGRGIAEIDGVEHEVGPGDFMGFPAPSIGHHLRNPHDAELVYLAGGEIRTVDISDFPRSGKRIVRIGEAIAVHDLADAAPFAGFPPIEPPR